MEGLGIVVIGDDPEGVAKMRALGFTVSGSSTPLVPFAKTLIVAAGTRVPFDLIDAAWRFLDRWDVAVPLWKNGVLAVDIGEPDDRAQTLLIARDLRVPLHACELVFARAGGDGEKFIAAWSDELQYGGDKRLAFLRALHIVKPRMCVLPATWLAEARRHDPTFSVGRRGSSARPIQPPSRPMVTVEVSPGRYVKAHAGDEEKVIAQFERMRGGRVV